MRKPAYECGFESCLVGERDKLRTTDPSELNFPKPESRSTPVASPIPFRSLRDCFWIWNRGRFKTGLTTDFTDDTDFEEKEPQGLKTIFVPGKTTTPGAETAWRQSSVKSV
jgi:hypothetical protein